MKPSKSNPLFARFFRGNTLVTAVVLSLGAASLPKAAAQSISVNFGADRSGSSITEAGKTSGAVPVAGNLWNNTAVNGGGTLGSLLDSTGAATTGSVTWTCQNTWQSGSGGATATSENGDLTKGYLDDSGAGWTATLKSPYLYNDIYIIHATDQGNPATMSAVSVNGVFYKGNGAGGTVLASGVGDSWSAANFTTADTLTESTHFIKVLNQPTVSLVGYNSSPGRAAIGGVQVVNAYTGTLSFWDTDGATPGAGGATPAGTWNATNTNWSSNSLGNVDAGTWTASNAAVFAAGTAATGAYTVQVEGPVTADAVWVKDGTVTLADGGSGVLTLAGSALLRGDTGLVVNAPISAAALNTSGNITLGSTANSITGLATISGTTTLATAQTFGNLAGGGTVALGTNALTVGGNDTDSTFPGLFTGSGSITKTGTGRLSLNGNTTGYTGTLSADAGVLRIGAGGTSGSLSGTVAVNGTVELFRSDTNTQPAVFTGTGALNILGTGVSGQSDYTLSGATSGFTGAVSIDDARLRVSPANLDNCASITAVSGGQAWLFAGNHAENYIINGNGWLEPTGELGAIRFETNANLTGTLTVASDSRLVAWGTTGTVSGTLSGTAALNLNLAGNPGTINFTGNTVGYTGAMTLNAGTLNVGASGLGGSLTVVAGTANVTGGIATDLTVSGTAATIGGAVGGAVLSNAGITTLNGAVTGNVTVATGTTYINSAVGGNVAANGGAVMVAGPVTGTLTVADGVSLAGEGSAATLNLGAATGATLRVNAATTGSLTAGDLNLLATNTVQLTHLPTASGPFVVLSYTGSLSGDEGNFFVPPGTFRGDPEVQHDSGAKQFTLELDTQTRTWDNGSGNANWDTSSLNWQDGDEVFFAGDPVVFTDTAVTTVNLATGLQPMSIKMENTVGNNYIFTGGSITGSTGLTMTGGGNLTLGGANAFTGAISVNSGVLAMGSAGAFGLSSGITVANGATVDINGQSPGNATTGGYTYTIQGTGVDNSGAIRNTAGAVYANAGVRSLVLADHATVNAVGRFDIGFANQAGFGTVTGNGKTLTKIGTGGIAMRGDASGTVINIVVEAGDLWAENHDGSLGGATGSVTANGTARVGSYGPRTIATPVTLNAGTSLINLGGGAGVWTGPITATGAITIDTGDLLAIDGTLTSSNNITKTGGSALVLQGDSSAFSGKWTVNGGTLRIENSAALGTTTGADLITMGNGTALQGGTVTATASATLDASRGITHNAPAGTVYYNAGGAANTLTINSDVVGGTSNLATQDGTVAFGGAVALADPANTNANLVVRNNSTVSFLTGATVNVRQLNLGLNGQGNNSHMSIAPGATITTTRLVSSDGGNTVSNINQAGGTLNITGNNSSNSTSASFLLGHWNGSTTYNLTGGVLNSTAAMLSLGWDAGGGVNFNQSGGTANLFGINLGNSRNNAAAYNLTGGRLNIGGNGITDASNKAVNLGGGTVGAFASWIGTKPMTITGTGGNPTFDTLDSVDGTTPRTITLTGALANTGGAGFTKTGAGVLALNSAAAGTFNGTATVTGGSLMVNANSLAAGTVEVKAGGAIQAGTIAATGTGNLANLTLDGGTAAIRVGTTTDLLNVTGTFAVNTPSTITVQPGNAITTLPATFTVLDYTGTIGGLGADGLDLNTELTYVSANPHLAGSLVHDEGETRIQVTITAADTVVWKGDGDASGNWDVSNSTNWVLGSDLVTPTKFYDFDVVTLNDEGISAPNVNLVGTISPASVAVANTSGTYVLTGSGIGGSGGLTKSGAGGLTLLNDNFYGGVTTITGGTVTVGAGGTAGTLGGTGAITVADATLVFNRSDAQTLSRALTGANGSLVKEGAGTLTLTGAPPALTGSGSIVVNNGTLALSTSDYTAVGAPGGLIVNAPGILRINPTNPLNNAMPITVNAGGIIELNAYHNHFHTLNLNGATVMGIGNGAGKYNAEDSTFDNVVTVGGTAMSEFKASTGGRYNLNGGSFTVGEVATGTDLLFSGPLIGGTLTKYGAGTMTLTGDNSFTGGTNLEAGTLEAASVADAGGVGSIGTGYIGINNGSTFRYTGTTAETTVRALWIDRGTQTNVIEITDAGGAITFTGTDGLINKPFSKAGPGSLTINDVLEDGTVVTVDGGKLTLGGTNTYTGDTTVNAGGTLVVDGDSIADAGALKINGSGKVEVTEAVDPVVEIVNTLFINGVQVAAGTYGATGSGAATVDDTHFAGAGVVQVTTNPPAGYTTWATTNAPTGGAGDDYDGDGVNNGVEYVLGGSAATNDLGKLPTVSASGPDLVFTFVRDKDSKTPDTTVEIEVGTTLAGWTTYGLAAPEVTVVPDLNGDDVITLTVPKGTDAAKFGRLKVTIN
jgi:autotransporter-associated beta strand protein